MWISFAFSCLFFLLFLYVPGFIFFYNIARSKIKAFVYAPLASIFFYSLIGILFNLLNVFANAITVGLSALALSLLTYLAISIYYKKKNGEKPSASFNLFSWIILGIYLIFGCVITCIFFVIPLDGPGAFAQNYDNIFHYNVIEAFAESGQWSMLHIDAYLGSDASIDPFPGSGYYPSSWHLMAAIICSLMGTTATIAANVVNTIFIAIIFPSGIFALISAIFHNRRILIAGAFASLACASFPWLLYNTWPLFPNATSLCLSPLVAAAFINFLGNDGHINKNYVQQRVDDLLAFFIGFCSIVFLQPNSVFSLFVLLAPFFLWKILLVIRELRPSHLGCKLFLVTAAYIALFLLSALLLYNVSFLQSVINFYWPPILSPQEALTAILKSSFTTGIPQWCISICILCGILLLLFKERTKSWLIVSYALFLGIFFVSSTEGDTFLKHFVSGYWYTDPYRTSAICTLAAIPLTAVGITAISYAIEFLFSKIKKRSKLLTFVCTLLPIFTFVIASYTPYANTSAGLYNQKLFLEANYDLDWNYLDKEEIAFIDKAKKYIPEKAVVINQPFDGSMFAYAFSGLNVYYRSAHAYDTASETVQSVVIREGLCNIDSDTSVQNSIRSIQGEYLILLKPDFLENNLLFSTYKPQEWTGINQASANTNLKLLLEENGMKLYKIELR